MNVDREQLELENKKLKARIQIVEDAYSKLMNDYLKLRDSYIAVLNRYMHS